MKKISPQKITLATELLASDSSLKDTAKCVGVTERTIRRWSKRPDVAAQIEREAEEARSLARQQTSFIAAATVDRAITCLTLLEICATSPDLEMPPARMRCIQAILRESHYWASFLERSEKRGATGLAAAVGGLASANSKPVPALAKAPSLEQQKGGAPEPVAPPLHENGTEKRTVPDNKPTETTQPTSSQESQLSSQEVSAAENSPKKRTIPDIMKARTHTPPNGPPHAASVVSPDELEKLMEKIFQAPALQSAILDATHKETGQKDVTLRRTD